MDSCHSEPNLAQKQPDSSKQTRKLSNVDLLALQVRAFLEASEDVDIDVETVEDLMQTISEEHNPDAAEHVGRRYAEDSDHDSDDTEGGADSDAELDVSSLYCSRSEVEPSWTKQETRYMLQHLKERGMSSWIQEYVIKRGIPILKLLCAFGIKLCPELQQKRPTTMLYFLRVAMSRELRLRDKLPQYNTLTDAVNLIRSSQRIVILTGAGISVSCGIPDFRSRNGLYATLKDQGDYGLDDPQQMFDISYFRENPSGNSFASQIYPSNFIPSPCHRFIRLIETKGKLLRNYTQNIDTLETLAGVQRVLQCHGSFATASCIQCRRRVPGTEIEADILKRRVPLCTACNPPSQPKSKPKSKKKRKGQWDSEEEDESDGSEYPSGIMKPDITFFGEKLTDDFEDSLLEDRDKVDLLLVIGTSLKVAPVADTLCHLPHSIPQILINKTPVKHINPDIILLGNADNIVQHLCQELGWELPPPPVRQSAATRSQPPRGNGSLKRRPSSELEIHPERVGNSHIWLFPGAEGGKWLEDLKLSIIQTDEGQSNGWLTSACDGVVHHEHPREPKRAKTS